VKRKKWQELKRKEKLLKQALKVFKVEPKDLPRVISRFLREVNEMEKEIERLKRTCKL